MAGPMKREDVEALLASPIVTLGPIDTDVTMRALAREVLRLMDENAAMCFDLAKAEAAR